MNLDLLIKGNINQNMLAIEIADRKINKCDDIFGQSSEPRDVCYFAFRYWLSYGITGNEVLLEKAGHRSINYFAKNSGSIELCLLTIFMNIEMDNLEKVEDSLENLSQFKKYLKNYDKKTLILIGFFQSIIKLKQGRLRPALKFEKNMENLIAGEYTGFYLLLFGIIKYYMNQFYDAFLLFEKSFKVGFRGCFLYFYIYEFLKNRNKIKHRSPILIYVFNWCISQGIDIDGIIDYYEDNVFLKDSRNFFIFERIYEIYPKNWILKEICQNLILNKNYEKKYFKYYKLAEEKQLEIRDLSINLVSSAYKNGFHDISRNSLKQFLDHGDIDIEIKGYVYCLLLTDKKFQSLKTLTQQEIMEFSFYCLENQIKDRYVNCIYKYLLDNEKAYNISDNYVLRMEDVLFEDLFYYNVTVENKDVKNIWIVEKDCKEPVCYVVSDGRIRVSVFNNFFSYICFSEGMKNILDSEINISKIIENADISLYFRYYKRGIESEKIVMAISKYLIEEEYCEEIWKKSVSILCRAVNIENISKAFKNLAYATLGNILFNKNVRDKALEYYKATDENYLDDKYIEQIFLAFLDMGEIQRALRVLNKKSHCISDKTLFRGLKQISLIDKFKPDIANVTYEILLKSWYDKGLLDLCIKYYKGSQEDWQKLGKALADISYFHESLDELILKNSIWMHKLDEGSQKAFVRMYKNSRENDLIGMFIYYCVFETIVNDFKLEYEVIGIFEKICRKLNDSLLCFALCHCYLHHKITTIYSEEIIQKSLVFMEEFDILFPIFKKSINKKTNISYIIKNTPFIYRCLPDKNVLLYYKFSEDMEFRCIKMQYFQFGIYLSKLTHFYGEKIIYYFCEESPTGSIVTKEQQVENNDVSLNNEHTDLYFTINNGLIYEKMFKHDKVLDVVEELLKDNRNVKGKLL